MFFNIIKFLHLNTNFIKNLWVSVENQKSMNSLNKIAKFDNKPKNLNAKFVFYLNFMCKIFVI